VIDKPIIIDDDESLFKSIEEISFYDYVLVRTRKDFSIKGIVTSSDLSQQFKNLSEPFLLIGRCKNLVAVPSSSGKASMDVLSGNSVSIREKPTFKEVVHGTAPLGLVLGMYIVFDVIWEALTKNISLSADIKALLSRYVPIYIGLLIGSCHHRSSAFYFRDCNRCGDWICRLINAYRTRAHCIVRTLSRSTGKGVHHKKVWCLFAQSQKRNQQISKSAKYYFGDVRVKNVASNLE